MARYNKLSNKISIAPASVPNVSVSMDDPVARVELASSRSLDARVGQLQKLFTNMATQQATAEGLRYGAMSAPTQEQIQLAESTGKPISVDDLAGDPNSFNVFQQAARKGALAVTESRFTGAARRALTDVYINATTNKNVSPADLQGQLDDVVLSFSSSLSDVDPLSGAKVDASLSLVANGMMQTYSKTFATRQASANKAAALARVPGHLEGIKAVISGGGENYMQGVNALKSLVANDLNTSGVSATKFKTVMNGVDTAIKSMTKGIIKNHAVGLVTKPADTLVVLKHFEKFNFKDKHINTLAFGLKKSAPDDYAKLRQELRSEISAQANLLTQVENENIRKQNESRQRATDIAYTAMADGDIPKALEQLPFMSPEKRFALQNTLKTGGLQGSGNQRTKNNLTDMVNNPAYSVAEVRTAIDNATTNEEINFEEAGVFIAELKTLRNTRVRLVMQRAQSQLRLTPDQLESIGNDPTPEIRRKKAIYDSFNSRLANALLSDPDTNPQEFFISEFTRIKSEENARHLKIGLANAQRHAEIIHRSDEDFPAPTKLNYQDAKSVALYLTVIRGRYQAEKIKRSAGDKETPVGSRLKRLIKSLENLQEALIDE